MAAEYLTVETAGTDAALLMTVADIALRSDRADDGMTLLRRLLEEDPTRRESITLLGWSVAEQKPDAGFQVMELVADSAVAQQEWHEAIAALQEFVTRVPNHTPALMRLVEICVDGGLEAAMYSAQAQLADAYIAVGAANEARFIAEDLVAREPWEKANIDRFRRALVLLGEPDPDGLIAARLSGESPFTATDLSAFGGGSLFGDAPAAAEPALQEEADLNALHLDVIVTDPFSSTDNDTPRRLRPDEQHHFSLSEKGIDVLAILGPEPVAAPEPSPQPTSSEVDITLGLDLKPIPAATPPPAPDLDGVFGSMREKAARRTGLDESEKEYKRGLALRKAGDIDGCIQALETASRAPKLRFATSRMIAKLYRDRNQLPQALEWLERASQAPAPTSDDAHQLKYEMAEALEKTGDVARALAVCTQLKAEAGDYRDVAERIDRLSKVQAG
jgi:tetratricopeptide (TPR) repeat protein